MERRQVLEHLVIAMLAIAFLAFIYVSFRSLSSGVDSEPEQLQNVHKGQTAMRRMDGRRVWISHLSDGQKTALQAFSEDTVVVDTGCPLTARYCIVDAATKRVGVELVYSSERPSVMLKSKAWEGGFIDPDSGAIYDLLGRAYQAQAESRLLEIGVR